MVLSSNDVYAGYLTEPSHFSKDILVDLKLFCVIDTYLPDCLEDMVIDVIVAVVNKMMHSC
jgi:hypothetical protein